MSLWCAAVEEAPKATRSQPSTSDWWGRPTQFLLLSGGGVTCVVLFGRVESGMLNQGELPSRIQERYCVLWW